MITIVHSDLRLLNVCNLLANIIFFLSKQRANTSTIRFTKIGKYISVHMQGCLDSVHFTILSTCMFHYILVDEFILIAELIDVKKYFHSMI